MKITQKQLRQIIKEEVSRISEMSGGGLPDYPSPRDVDMLTGFSEMPMAYITVSNEGIFVDITGDNPRAGGIAASLQHALDDAAMAFLDGVRSARSLARALSMGYNALEALGVESIIFESDDGQQSAPVPIGPKTSGKFVQMVSKLSQDPMTVAPRGLPARV